MGYQQEAWLNNKKKIINNKKNLLFSHFLKLDREKNDQEKQQMFPNAVNLNTFKPTAMIGSDMCHDDMMYKERNIR